MPVKCCTSFYSYLAATSRIIILPIFAITTDVTSPSRPLIYNICIRNLCFSISDLSQRHHPASSIQLSPPLRLAYDTHHLRLYQQSANPQHLHQTMPSQSPTPYHPHPLLFLPLLHPPTGAASCPLPTVHPSPPNSPSQHDQWNPSANSSYSINVHASPDTFGSKFSHTGCAGFTSRVPGKSF